VKRDILDWVRTDANPEESLERVRVQDHIDQFCAHRWGHSDADRPRQRFRTPPIQSAASSSSGIRMSQPCGGVAYLNCCACGENPRSYMLNTRSSRLLFDISRLVVFVATYLNRRPLGLIAAHEIRTELLR